MIKDSDPVAYPLVAVAISKDKNSQCGMKWAIDNLVTKGQTLTLAHVNLQSTASNDRPSGYKGVDNPLMKELFLPFRCFCKRKDVDNLQ